MHTLRDAVEAFTFAPPVHTVYNPLRYAGAMHEAYIQQGVFAACGVVMLGMNPGPWGMAQTGVPFGEVAAVRDWLKLDAPVDQPDPEHPKRPVQGLACARSEVSGRRLWGLMQDRFDTPEAFHRQHFIVNYCPLCFMGETGKNLTPDKLPAAERAPLEQACDAHLQAVLEALQPQVIVAVGAFAETCAKRIVGDTLRVVRILHPSPASPLANKDWAGTATRQLIEAGVWS